jgi:hypothetical protein
MAKGARRQRGEPEKKPANVIPRGYLPTADPPRKNILLLAIAAACLLLWMLALVYLAFWG